MLVDVLAKLGSQCHDELEILLQVPIMRSVHGQQLMNPSHGFDGLDILQRLIEDLFVFGDHFVHQETDAFGQSARETRLGLC